MRGNSGGRVMAGIGGIVVKNELIKHNKCICEFLNRLKISKLTSYNNECLKFISIFS